MGKLSCGNCGAPIGASVPGRACPACGCDFFSVGLRRRSVWECCTLEWWMNSSHIGIAIILLLVYVPAAVFIDAAVVGRAWVNSDIMIVWILVCTGAMATIKRRFRSVSPAECGSCQYMLLSSQEICPECGNPWRQVGLVRRRYSAVGKRIYLEVAALAVLPIVIAIGNIVYVLLG